MNEDQEKLMSDMHKVLKHMKGEGHLIDLSHTLRSISSTAEKAEPIHPSMATFAKDFLLVYQSKTFGSEASEASTVPSSPTVFPASTTSSLSFAESDANEKENREESSTSPSKPQCTPTQSSSHSCKTELSMYNVIRDCERMAESEGKKKKIHPIFLPKSIKRSLSFGRTPTKKQEFQLINLKEDEPVKEVTVVEGEKESEDKKETEKMDTTDEEKKEGEAIVDTIFDDTVETGSSMDCVEKEEVDKERVKGKMKKNGGEDRHINMYDPRLEESSDKSGRRSGKRATSLPQSTIECTEKKDDVAESPEKKKIKQEEALTPPSRDTVSLGTPNQADVLSTEYYAIKAENKRKTPQLGSLDINMIDKWTSAHETGMSASDHTEGPALPLRTAKAQARANLKADRPGGTEGTTTRRGMMKEKREKKEETIKMYGHIHSPRSKKARREIKEAGMVVEPEHSGTGNGTIWGCGALDCKLTLKDPNRLYKHMVDVHYLEGALIGQCMVCSKVMFLKELIVHRTEKGKENCKAADLKYWTHIEKEKEEVIIDIKEMRMKKRMEFDRKIAEYLRTCLDAKCAEFNKQFPTFDDVSKHNLEVHSCYYRYQCDNKTNCGRTFLTPVDFIRHRQRFCPKALPISKKKDLAKKNKTMGDEIKMIVKDEPIDEELKEIKEEIKDIKVENDCEEEIEKKIKEEKIEEMDE